MHQQAQVLFPPVPKELAHARGSWRWLVLPWMSAGNTNSLKTQLREPPRECLPPQQGNHIKVPAGLNDFLHVKDKRTSATVVAAAMTAI